MATSRCQLGIVCNVTTFMAIASQKDAIWLHRTPGENKLGDSMQKTKKQINHDPIVARFGQRLKEIRASRGMTQAQLAEAAQVTISYITRLESGTPAPGIDLVARFAALSARTTIGRS